MSEVVREVIKRNIEVGEYVSYYCHSFSCGNCGCHQHVYVLKGRSLKGLDTDCERCGCMVKFSPFSSAFDDISVWKPIDDPRWVPTNAYIFQVGKSGVIVYGRERSDSPLFQLHIPPLPQRDGSK